MMQAVRLIGTMLLFLLLGVCAATAYPREDPASHAAEFSDGDVTVRIPGGRSTVVRRPDGAPASGTGAPPR